MKNSLAVYRMMALAALLIACVGLVLWYQGEQRRVHFGFINTQKVLASFSEADKIQKEVDVQRQKFEGELQILKDSLAAFEKRMAESYARASMAEKTSLKKEQIRLLEQANRFEEVQSKKLLELQAQKMQDVFQKINGVLDEYGKYKGYDVIFGTAEGSILYGNGTAADLTAEFSHYLNDRYR